MGYNNDVTPYVRIAAKASICIYLSKHLSLSLYIYIYIHIFYILFTPGLHGVQHYGRKALAAAKAAIFIDLRIYISMYIQAAEAAICIYIYLHIYICNLLRSSWATTRT